MVVMGVKMIYVPWMPGHRKRLTQTYVVQMIILTPLTVHCVLSISHCSMLQLIKPSADKEYVDLTLSFANPDGDDSPGPPVRYFFK